MPTDILEQIRRNGNAVHLDLQAGPYLADGTPVNRKLFDRMLADGRLIPGADALFGAPPQTYYLTEE